jgi:hypothetical protein
MTITITLDPSWLAHPRALRRMLDHCRSLETVAPWTPSTREPGDDDDLATLLDGIDAAELVQAPPAVPAPAPPPKPRPATSATSTPTNGKGLYRWACDRKCLPEVNRAGKARGFPKMVSDWTTSDVATVFEELTRPATNGRPQ